MIEVSINGSLHWLTWKRNIFTSDVKKWELLFVSTFFTTSKSNDINDIRLVEYKEKLNITCIDKESDFKKVWIMKSYNIR
jgi:phosphopantetheine adenylyltransferase